MDRAVLAAIVEYVETSQKVIALLLEQKGDIAGHDFHGNRYTGGVGVLSRDALSESGAREVAADQFRPAIAAARAGARGAFLSLYSEAEYAKMKCFLTSDGKAGGALKNHSDGHVEIVSLFNNGGAKGVGLALFRDMIKAGGNYAECYGDTLKSLYQSEGFKVIDSAKFDREQAAPDWNYARDGEPNYYALSLTGKAASEGDAKGDVVGHGFHGNRWTGGIGGGDRFVGGTGGHTDIMRPTPYKTDAARVRGQAQQKETIDKALVKYGITTGHVSANLDKVWSSAKDTVAMREGRVWYEKSRGASIDALKGLKGADGKPLSEAQRVAMVAACSPRCAWEKNLSATGTSARAGQTVYPNLEAARAAAQIVSDNPKISIDEAQAERLKNPKWELGPVKPGTYEAKDLSSALLSHVIVGGGHGVLALPDSVEKAIDIARGVAIDDELTGDKVRNFYTNLINPGHTDAVTVDTWMARIALGDKMSDADLQVFLAKPAGYDYVAEQIRTQARAAGVVPQQYQAVTWVQARDEANGEVEYLKDKLRRSTH